MASSLKRQVKVFEIVDLVETGSDDVLDTHEVVRIRPSLDPDVFYDGLEALPRVPADEGGPSAFFEGRSAYSMHSRVHRSDRPRSVDVVVLARVRAGEGGFATVNLTTGEPGEIVLADEEGLAEETHLAFLPGNIVLAVSNGQGAPGPVRIEEYLQKQLVWPDGRQIKVVALTPPERIEALQRDNMYTRAARVRIPAVNHRLLPESDGFYRMVGELAEERYGPGVSVDMRVKIPTKGDPEAADLAFADFLAVAGTGAADALELTYADRETERGRSVNLINDILAYTTAVTVERDDDDDTPRVFSEWSTSRALDTAYDVLREQIEAAIADEDE